MENIFWGGRHLTQLDRNWKPPKWALELAAVKKLRNSKLESRQGGLNVSSTIVFGSAGTPHSSVALTGQCISKTSLWLPPSVAAKPCRHGSSGLTKFFLLPNLIKDSWNDQLPLSISKCDVLPSSNPHSSVKQWVKFEFGPQSLPGIKFLTNHGWGRYEKKAADGWWPQPIASPDQFYRLNRCRLALLLLQSWSPFERILSCRFFRRTPLKLNVIALV